MTTPGGQGFCSEEPLVQVERPGEGVVTYRKMTPEKVPEIIEHYVIGGHPVTQWALAQSQPSCTKLQVVELSGNRLKVGRCGMTES